jgi:molybdopterin molybdotransferase
VLAAGRRLSPRDLALWGALGLDRVAVTRRVRVALLSIGDELTVPGDPLPPGGVFDASGVLLRALLAAPPIERLSHATIADAAGRIEAALRAAVAGADLVIASGGLGAAGPPGALLRRLGGRLILEHTAMKPGKPAVFGRVGEVPICGLPGNPVAAFVTFALVVRPLLARRTGAAPRQPLAMLADAGFAHRRERGRTELLPVTLEPGAGRPRLQRPAVVGAAKLTALADADGLAVIPHDRGDLVPGEAVAFVPFSEVSGL